MPPDGAAGPPRPRTDPGPRTFRKARAGATDGFFACEAAGLEWLRVPGGPRVVEVRGVDREHLDLERLEPAAGHSGPTEDAARALGERLAVLHTTPAPARGAPPAGWTGDAFFGPLGDPLPLPTGAWPTWGAFYAEARLRAVAQQGHTRGALSSDERDALHRLADEVERVRDDGRRPGRVHGDLWSGNVVWTADGAVLIDPAAHGGDGESDLAMLALFGAPHLDALVAAYDAVSRPRPGRAGRVRLHQVYPVAVHAVLFGGAYHAHLARLLADLAARPAR
ncbi:fructosamine kinase family protein [Luteimicrobium subarcticum]|uniref:Fructosamine-3-kinase n=1 Tax=Luteimicrobium subarcticum TaxID=620910 RepID=A0A2M8W3K6_9MICO|nr:fructosamine kinase family protein [Luteimicrobium subarcticum]PJI85497.1 fructosamine-3-kinase [Luteimicrobium subarcticum]